MLKDDLKDLINDVVRGDDTLKNQLLNELEQSGKEQEVFDKVSSMFKEQTDAIKEKYAPQMKEMQELDAEEEKELDI